MSDVWRYRAQLDQVVDGDTIDLTVDLGFRTYKKLRVRLAGVDTAEIYGTSHESDEYQLGKTQSAFVEEWLDSDEEWPFILVSKEEAGKYGRWLGDIEKDDERLSEVILEQWPEAEYE